MRESNKQHQPLLANEAPSEVERMGLTWLITAAIATIILWQVPAGEYILYPFTILATWFHEMSHGLMALVLGGNFQQLMIFSNGSGVAYYSYSGSLLLGSLGRALVAAAGPMGPPIAGAALILASRSFKTASWSLKILGGFLLLSTAIWVRSLFGLVVIPLLGLVILGFGLKATRWMQGFAVQFLGVQACVSTYHQLDYLFSYSAGPLGISDTAQMQQQLLLPYWFWGALMAIASLIILVQSLRLAYRAS
ncbi:MAG: M50 family metallopeptidase [Nostochopsis sp.]